MPYGSRRLAEVRELSEGTTRFLLAQGARVIVIACNTASAAALHYLRCTFPQVPFVGMEPAVKPAVERTCTGVVGVIATQATFQGELFASLLERYSRDIRVIHRTCPGLVEAVEMGALDTLKTKKLLQQCLQPLIEAGADHLVLGCTHYPFLQSTIEQIVGADIEVINPAPAVARQTGRVLAQLGPRVSLDAPAQHTFYTSGNGPAFTKMVERLLPTTDRAGATIKIQAVRWQDSQLVSHA